jgi:hypothetical protein
LNRKNRKLSDSVSSFCDDYWEWFVRSETAPYKITGKYLFFSANRNLLVKIAVEELETGGFHQAKTHMADGIPPTGEYVLCLYYKDNSRRDELAAKYQNRPELKYRYWKSDEDTRAGKYSKEFLEKLSPAERNRFQRNT